MSTFRIIEGDVRERLKEFSNETFDACLCDPPYGLSSTEKRNMRRMSPRASSRERASGFMGMQWDAAVPGPDAWAEIGRVLKPGSAVLAFGHARTFHRLVCAMENGGLVVADTLCWLHGQGFPKGKAQLKPAWEPITLAFKPGRRALDLDGCRIPAAALDSGRWPANVAVDEQVAALLDQQSGVLTSGANPTSRRSGKFRNTYGEFSGWEECVAVRGADRGGASRFFYCAKARGRERGEGNEHPTVKPTALTEWLARLLLAPDKSRLLVPYCGSGSEIIGAIRAGWRYVDGIEGEREYIAIAKERIPELELVESATAVEEPHTDLPLFAEATA